MPDAQPTSEGAAAPVLGRSTLPDDKLPMAFLLRLLSTAPDRRLTRGELNKRLRIKAAGAVGLTPELARPLLERCSDQGYLRADTGRRTAAYALTEAGAAFL